MIIVLGYFIWNTYWICTRMEKKKVIPLYVIISIDYFSITWKGLNCFRFESLLTLHLAYELTNVKFVLDTWNEMHVYQDKLVKGKIFYIDTFKKNVHPHLKWIYFIILIKYYYSKYINSSILLIVGAWGPRNGTMSCGCHYKDIVSPKRESTRG